MLVYTGNLSHIGYNSMWKEKFEGYIIIWKDQSVQKKLKTMDIQAYSKLIQGLCYSKNRIS